MLNTAFSPWPSFTTEEAEAAQRVLLSNSVNYWTGKECREFEKEFSAWAGTRHAVALANGTLALDIALKALGIGPGDEVVVSPRTFIASVSCVVNAGATPVFADVDMDSGNINVHTIAAVLTPRTKAVICVHLAGWPCDIDSIMALAAQHGLKVIEDCAQAHGARYKGRSVGSIGHVGAWSFCQDKIMSTGGEGGMVTCNDESLWRAMWAYKDHGKSYAAVYEREHPPGFRWLHEGFGTNWRMLEMQAVIGRIQLRRMEKWASARAANAMAIQQTLLPFAGEGGVLRVPSLRCSTCPIRAGLTQSTVGTPEGVHVTQNLCYGGDQPSPANNQACSCRHAYYKYYAYLRPENFSDGWNRDRIIEEINARGVPCYVGSCSEVYLEKAFDNTGWRPKERFPVARALGETSLMFLVHPTLSAAEIKKTQAVISEVLEAATNQATA
jgi:dTDP-4-amino-4,6-dideoxygalactose transaminase